MKNKHKLILLIIGLAFLSGCSTNAVKTNDNDSFALKVIKASDTFMHEGIKDHKVDSIQEFHGKIREEIVSASAGALAIGHATNSIMAPFGMHQSIPTGLMLIEFFNNDTPRGYHASSFINWHPVGDHVRSADQFEIIQLSFFDRLNKAAYESLLSMSNDYEFKDVVRKSGSMYSSGKVVNGPFCEDWSCYLFAGDIVDDNLSKWMYYASSNRKPIKKTPDFISNPYQLEKSVRTSSALVFSKSKRNSLSDTTTQLPINRFTGITVDGFDYERFWSEVSIRMNDNDYLFVGPLAIGNNKKIPLLLNQGSSYLFISEHAGQ